MKNINTKEILSRLKDILDVRTDDSLSTLIGVSKRNLAAWKQRNSMDYEYVLNFAVNQNINTHWLLTGKGERLLYTEECIANVPMPLAFGCNIPFFNHNQIMDMGLGSPWIWHYSRVRNNTNPKISLENNDLLIIRKMTKDKQGEIRFSDSTAKYWLWHEFDKNPDEAHIEVAQYHNDPYDEIALESAVYEQIKMKYMYFVEYVFRRPAQEKFLVTVPSNRESFDIDSKTNINDIAESNTKDEEKRLFRAMSKLRKVKNY